MKIVFLDAYTTNPGDLTWEDLHRLGSLSIYDRTAPSDIVERSKGAEVLITNKCILTAQILEQLPQLKLVCVAATGYNNIDVKAAKARDIQVANVKNYSTLSVVQHVFALILNQFNRVSYYDSGVRLNRWANSNDFAYTDEPILNLSTMTLGIVGYGTIGKAVARTAVSFGMEVFAFKRNPEIPDTPGVKLVSLSELLSKSNVVSLHVPANKETCHMINAKTLSLMKWNTLLINTARGSVIDEIALKDWLIEHPKACALLDVLNQEPPPKDHPLSLLNNCTITPHQAWIGQASRQKLLSGIVENISQYIQGTLISL